MIKCHARLTWLKINLAILFLITASTAFSIPASRTFVQNANNRDQSFKRDIPLTDPNFSYSEERTFITKKREHSPSTRHYMASTNDLDENSSKEMLFNKAVSIVGKRTNLLVSLTFFLSLAYYRDAFMVSFFIGAVSNGILGKILKKVISQARPEELASMDDIKLKPTDNGMPSSHGMSLGFICLITAMKLPEATIPLILFVASSLTYRVNSNLHTKEQIFVGLSLGVINGYVWKNLTDGTFALLPNINLADMISNYILPQSGVLPAYQLIVPALLGAATVGSVERRIGEFIQGVKRDSKVE